MPKSVLLALAVFVAALTFGQVATANELNAQDARVLEQLRKAGSNLKKPHVIDFHFYDFRSEDTAKRFANKFPKKEWKIRVHQAKGSNAWVVVATSTMVPDIAALSQLSAMFDTIAEEYGISYDGWETQVVD